MALKERLDSLSRGELAGLILVVALTLVGVGLWYSRSLPRPVDIATGASSSAPAGAAGGSAPFTVSATPGLGSPSPSGAPLIVDVTGYVHKAGVFELPPGSRVIDAIERAGGAKSNADLSAINLAALVTDGSQIIVPKEGGSATVGSTGASPGSSGASVVNVNSASETELETLTGIGPVLAAAILQYRTDHGPFTSVDQLEDVSGIGPATLEALRPQVTV
ncbi:MAG: helix-hairpin-helix domain-containing protein [Actinomycetota bacterium]